MVGTNDNNDDDGGRRKKDKLRDKRWSNRVNNGEKITDYPPGGL